MELSNQFTVSVPVEQAWSVLTDLERIAPCMPGAQLQEVEGDEYRGIVKVKVGPITAQYRGAARFVEQDQAAGRAVLKAEGRDTRGQGNASAVVTAELSPDGAGTRVAITTELAITGKVAQFGRGVLGDVSTKLLEQFVAKLESDVLSAAPAAEGPAAAPADGAAPAEPVAEVRAPADGERPLLRSIDAPHAEPVDLLDVAGGSVTRRIGPIAAAGIILGLIWWLIRRR
ncbi:MAG TPA: SRPBCC family protein [Acidimicrobiales bacterium]|nr:SRPBCC family protein [Acidimicrobiales bacterium]